MTAHTEAIGKIAVIDDDKGVREATRGLLRSLGYSVVSFASAEEFLDFPGRDELSCVITDVRMPGMGGIELLKRLVTEQGSPPVIVMTSFPEERVQESAVAAGARGFLIKPYRTQGLIECLKSAMST